MGIVGKLGMSAVKWRMALVIVKCVEQNVLYPKGTAFDLLLQIVLSPQLYIVQLRDFSTDASYIRE